jgi:antitoxin (DNA-binding transcriptional repressor) of toxin-antitoxin stability system
MPFSLRKDRLVRLEGRTQAEVLWLYRVGKLDLRLTTLGYAPCMTTIRIEDVPRDLLACLSKVEAGETVVIVRADRPIAELRPVRSQEGGLRPHGLCAGEFRVPDDFDEPLSEEILRNFEAG